MTFHCIVLLMLETRPGNFHPPQSLMFTSSVYLASWQGFTNTQIFIMFTWRVFSFHSHLPTTTSSILWFKKLQNIENDADFNTNISLWNVRYLSDAYIKSASVCPYFQAGRMWLIGGIQPWICSSSWIPPHVCVCMYVETATAYLHLRERCWKRRIRLCHSSFHSMTIERRLTVSPGCSPSFSLPKIRYDLQQKQ